MKPNVYLYQLKGGRWRVDVRQASLPQGRRRVTYSSKAKAQGLVSAINHWLFRSGPNPFEAPAATERRPTVKELLAWHADIYVSQVESEKSRVEMQGRRTMIERYPLAAMEAEAVTVFDLLEYRRARFAAKGRTPHSVRPDMVRLRAVFRAAKKKGKLAAHVFEALDDSEKKDLFGVWKPTPEFSKGKPIPLGDWEAILVAFPERDFSGALRFMAATGCRLDQAASLDWSRYRDMPIPGFDLIKQKKAERFVPLTSALREIVGERRAAGRVFDEDGTLYRRIKAAWRYRVQAYRLHDIRHTVGTLLRDAEGVENGASALGVTPAMMGIYGEHRRDARNAAALDAMQRRLGTYRGR